MFFSSTFAPRIPLKLARIGIARDDYGKALLPAKTSSYFDMQYMSKRLSWLYIWTSPALTCR